MDITIEEKKAIRKKAAKPLLWISMVSMVMLFAGLTSGYVVRRADGEWLTFDLPATFNISTALIVLSSLAMIFAHWSLKKGQQQGLKQGLMAAMVLGLSFALTQFQAWDALVEAGIYFTGEGSSASGSFLYAITGLHLLHMAGGLIALLVTLINAFRGKYSQEERLGFELCAIFWHFLGLLWLYLFLFLVFIR